MPSWAVIAVAVALVVCGVGVAGTLPSRIASLALVASLEDWASVAWRAVGMVSFWPARKVEPVK
jgi:hypothetical protein